jgi:hypothetical protein
MVVADGIKNDIWIDITFVTKLEVFGLSITFLYKTLPVLSYLYTKPLLPTVSQDVSEDVSVMIELASVRPPK